MAEKTLLYPSRLQVVVLWIVTITLVSFFFYTGFDEDKLVATAILVLVSLLTTAAHILKIPLWQS